MEYIKQRLPEWTSRLGGMVAMLPAMIDLTQKQTVLCVFVGVVLFGVPEDKFKRN